MYGHQGEKGRAGWDGLGDWDWRTQTIMRKTENQCEPTVGHRELCSTLCDDKEGKRVYLKLIYVAVQQTLPHHSKATKLQLKKKKFTHNLMILGGEAFGK